jgi:hypothetical protein
MPTSSFDEKALADKIRVMWSEKDMMSHDICSELGIALSLFNRIILKYNITKKRSVADENFA